jgi:flagellar biogenesis protein FliO
MDAGIYIRMVGAMAMVLGLLLVIFLCLKKWGSMVQGKGSGMIEVLETRMIMPRRHICVVKVGTRIMVLASSEKGFDYLGDIETGTSDLTVSEIMEENSAAE